MGNRLLFALRFFGAILLLLPLWWVIAPYYGWLLVQGCGVILRDVLGMPIAAGAVERAGLLNTETQLVFYLNDLPSRMPLMKLVTNVPPFLALMLATKGLTRRSRLVGLVAGAAILCALHAVFIVSALRFTHALGQAPALPTALSHVLISLPFLLWIVLGYLPAYRDADSPEA